MTFKVAPANRITRIVAAVAILGIAAMVHTPRSGPAAIIGAALAMCAAGILCIEARAYFREFRSRRDRYDLSLLIDTPGFQGPSRDDPEHGPLAPAWESEDGDTVYCHRCDVSMPDTYSICPTCGAKLGN
jgi:hypothetical protein